jgi:hypothetical protein
VVKHWDAIKEALANIFASVVNKAKEIWEGLVSIASGVVEKVKAVWSAIGSFFQGLWTAIKQGPAEALEYIKNAFSGLFDGLKDKFFGFINVIRDGWDKVKGFFGGLKDKVVSFVTGGGDESGQEEPGQPKPGPAKPEQPKPKTRQVDDMILTPQGGYSTSPDDFIMAMKNPADLLKSLMKFLSGPQLQPAFAAGGSLVKNAMNNAAARNVYHNSSSSETNFSAPISVEVNASGMTPEMATAAVKRGVEDAIKDAFEGARGTIPAPEARRY